MKNFKNALFLASMLGFFNSTILHASIDEALDQFKSKTEFSFFDDKLFVDFSGQLDFWGYHTDPASLYGFFFPAPGNSTDYSQRLNIFADIYVGDNFYGFVKFRWDDGVHPGVGTYYGETIQARWEEVFLRWTNNQKSFSLQAGQFTPLYGTFLRRQNTWDMGLISYPYLYEGVTSVSDQFVPADSTAFANRSSVPNNPLAWVPIVWAPLYPRGISAFGSFGDWEYALSAVNTAPSSRGIAWNNNTYSHHTIMGRLAYDLTPAHTIGVNLTHGPYRQTAFENALPAGKTVNDYDQTNLSFDYTYKGRNFSVWLEAFYSRFEIPNVQDDAIIYSYYIEGKYDLSAAWWVSARWNHEFYDEIDVAGISTDWDNRVYRIDFGFGFRPTRYFQIKAQYSLKDEAGVFENGKNLWLLETTFKF